MTAKSEKRGFSRAEKYVTLLLTFDYIIVIISKPDGCADARFAGGETGNRI